MKILVPLLLLAFLPGLSVAKEVSPLSTRCLSSDASKKAIKLQFSTVGDDATGWSGAFVKYGKNGKPITLVVQKTSSEELIAGRPAEFTTIWLEVVGDQITGTYEVATQGALINNFVYKNKRTGATMSFSESRDVELSDDGSCKW
ncbi:hypothetical protein AAKU64_003329 [Undibacterium sp. GrIS 1.8]|uniref:hypothetical protein n=1 Tax=Undibacterium sp. GrIS 1.8 TaxID=3143934 RepID=UPI003394A681